MEIIQFLSKVKIDLIVAFSSFVVSYIALYFTILKRGKIKVSVYTHINDINHNRVSSYNKINDCFIITIPTIIKNVGANAIAIKNVNWKLNLPDYLQYNIFHEPQIHSIINDLTVLKPYEHFIDNLQITIEVKGHGKGFTDDYKNLIQSIPDIISRSKSDLKCSYYIFGRSKIKRKSVSFDISKVVKHYLLVDNK